MIILMLPPNILIEIDEYIKTYHQNFGDVIKPRIFIEKVTNSESCNYMVIEEYK